jgi:hypothetical protein
VKLWVQKELPSVLAVDTDADIDAVAGKGGVEGVIAVFDISQVLIRNTQHTHTLLVNLCTTHSKLKHITRISAQIIPSAVLHCCLELINYTYKQTCSERPRPC